MYMPPGVNPIAVNKHIILYRISYMTPMEHKTLQDIKFGKLFELFKN